MEQIKPEMIGIKLDDTLNYLCFDRDSAEKLVEHFKSHADDEKCTVIIEKIADKTDKKGEYFQVTVKRRFSTLAEAKEQIA